MKSRTFFSFPNSANEQVYKSWEGAQPDSEPKLANGNTPYHRCYIQYVNAGWPGGRNFSMSSVNSVKSASSMITAWGLAVQLVVRQ